MGILNKLQVLCDNNDTAYFTINSGTGDTFYKGRVVAAGPAYSAIQNITDDGRDDGVVIVETDSVISVNDESERGTISKRYCRTGSVNKYKEFLCTANPFYSAVIKSRYQYHTVYVELRDEESDNITCMYGSVIEFDDDECILHTYDENGIELSYAYMFIHNISKIIYNSQLTRGIDLKIHGQSYIDCLL